MKKIVVLTSRFPYPLERGDKLRIYHQIRQLATQNEVVLIALTDDDVTTSDIAALAPFAKVHTVRISFFQKIFNLLKGWLRGLPLSVANFTNDDSKQKIHDIIAAEKPDLIYCQLIRMAEYVKDISGEKIIDYQDAFSENMRRRAKKANVLWHWVLQHEAERLATYEAIAFHFFQHHFIIATADRDFLQFEEKKKIEICQNGIDLDFFQSNNKIEKKYDITFVGNLGYHPNIEAAQVIVNQLLPKLKKQKPDIKILLAGARPSHAVQQLANENVVVSGWMEDIRVAYDEAKIFVAPLFQGSGQQNKVLETMAMQVPCITTSIVNNSTGATPDSEILIADTIDDFCEKIIFLLENKKEYNQLKDNALQFVKNNFSWEKASEPLMRICV